MVWCTATEARDDWNYHHLQLGDIRTILVRDFSCHAAKAAKKVNFSSFGMYDREVHSLLRLTSDGK